MWRRRKALILNMLSMVGWFQCLLNFDKVEKQWQKKNYSLHESQETQENGKGPPTTVYPSKTLWEVSFIQLAAYSTILLCYELFSTHESTGKVCVLLISYPFVPTSGGISLQYMRRLWDISDPNHNSICIEYTCLVLQMTDHREAVLWQGYHYWLHKKCAFDFTAGEKE